jgi:hypothetical protein
MVNFCGDINRFYFFRLWNFIFTFTLPDPINIGQKIVNQSTKIYDRTGEVLLYEVHV